MDVGAIQPLVAGAALKAITLLDRVNQIMRLMIDQLDLLKPIYRKTAAYGHFGRALPEFSWEHTTHLDAFKSAVGL